MSHDQLSVHEDVATEDHRASGTKDQLGGGGVGEECSHETEDDQNPQTAGKVWDPAREIILGLACEKGQGDKDSERDNECFDNDSAFVEGGDDADAVCFQGGKACEEDQVCGIRLALPEGEEQEGDRAEQRRPHHPCICLNPVSVALGEEGEGGQGGREKYLDGKDGIDFADEGHSDVESGLGDGAAELQMDVRWVLMPYIVFQTVP